MAPYLLCCIVLQLFLLSNAQHYLTVHPVDPVVSIGTSIQLNCSINCPSGRVTWKGLDNNDNRQDIAPGYSVQTLENISISMEGTRICVGSCLIYRTYTKTVQLHVYALPKSLHISNSIKNGVHYLNCSMEHVYPFPNITCYRGSEILGEATDSNEVQDEDSLFNVTWSWVIPEEDRLSETSYRCKAQVVVNGQTLTREGTLKISNKAITTAVPDSPTSQMTFTLSPKLETPYVTSTISTSQNPQTTQWTEKRTTTGSQQPTSLSTVITQSTRPTQSPTKPTNKAIITAVPDSPTTQMTFTLSPKLETPYVTSTISTSQNPQTTQWTEKRTTTGSQQPTSLSTVITQSTRPTQSPTKPTNKDGLYLMWTIVPATGLVGSFLLSLQIYRQLRKKGFFQLNHMEFPTVKKDAKLQESLQAIFCYDISTKKEFSMY